MNSFHYEGQNISQAERCVPQDKAAVENVAISSEREKAGYPVCRLISQSPLRFSPKIIERIKQHFTECEMVILASTAAQVNYWARLILVFVHRWHSQKFDPFNFAQAKTFRSRITRMFRRMGYSAGSSDPLSPGINLPRLAEKVGPGNRSSYGVLVHVR